MSSSGPRYPYGPPTLQRKFSKLNRQHYSSAVLYNQNVEVVRGPRGAAYNILPADLRFKIDWIMAAAPNLNSKYNADDFNIREIQKMMQNVFLTGAAICEKEGASSGIKKQKKVLILGAWGCGAFGNDLKVMTNEMVEGVRKFGHHFDDIVFAGD